jgi:hypothetical protein
VARKDRISKVSAGQTADRPVFDSYAARSSEDTSRRIRRRQQRYREEGRPVGGAPGFVFRVGSAHRPVPIGRIRGLARAACDDPRAVTVRWSG